MKLRPSVSHTQKKWSGDGEPGHGRPTVCNISMTQPIVSAAAMEPMPRFVLNALPNTSWLAWATRAL